MMPKIPVHLKPDLVPTPYRFTRIWLMRIRNRERCDGKQSIRHKTRGIETELIVSYTMVKGVNYLKIPLSDTRLKRCLYCGRKILEFWFKFTFKYFNITKLGIYI